MQDELKNNAQEARKDTAQGNVPQVERKPRRTQENGRETNAATAQAAAELLKSPKKSGTNAYLREQLAAATARADQLQAELQELRELCGQYKQRARYTTREYMTAYKLAAAFVNFENACKRYMRRILPGQTYEQQHEAYMRIFGGQIVELEKEIMHRLGGQIVDAAAGFID